MNTKNIFFNPKQFFLILLLVISINGLAQENDKKEKGPENKHLKERRKERKKDAKKAEKEAYKRHLDIQDKKTRKRLKKNKKAADKRKMQKKQGFFKIIFRRS